MKLILLIFILNMFILVKFSKFLYVWSNYLMHDKISVKIFSFYKALLLKDGPITNIICLLYVLNLFRVLTGQGILFYKMSLSFLVG